MYYTQHHVQARWILFATLVLSLLGIGFAGSVHAQQDPPAYTLDHFKCYDARGKSANDIVFLLDQFGIQDKTFERDIAKEPEIFCNPTRKIHGEATVGISDPNAHLTWYEIRSAFDERFAQRDVMVFNQFAPNGQKLTVRRPAYLAVPTRKVLVDGKPTEQAAPQGLDHFKCYQVDGKVNAQSVRLSDQFSPANTLDTFRVLEARYLCNPVVKVHFLGFGEKNEPLFNVAQIQHPDQHLVCYGIEANRNVAHALVIGNQFGPQQNLSTRETQLLCVPSTKQVIRSGT